MILFIFQTMLKLKFIIVVIIILIYNLYFHLPFTFQYYYSSCIWTYSGAITMVPTTTPQLWVTLWAHSPGRFEIEMSRAAKMVSSEWIMWIMSIHKWWWYTYTSGWWYTYPSETYEFVSWDDDIPNIWKNHVPNHQPVHIYIYHIYIY